MALVLVVTGAQAGGGGFNPDSGYALSGTPAFNSQITVSNGGNPFGSIGPLVIMMDTFATASAGALPSGRAGDAGSKTWTGPGLGSTSAPQFTARLNASGTGRALSFQNNESPGVSGAPFGRQAFFALGSDYTQGHLSYNENWRANGPVGRVLRNNAGGGGGYYKQNWWLKNNGSINYGATSFDYYPTFLEQASEGSVTSATWAAGVATIVTSNFSAYRFPSDTSWSTALRSSSNAAWNIAAATATYISDTSFSYPLASDPGTYTGGAVCVIPGGGPLHGSGVASANILQAWACNNNHSGAGLRSVAGDAVGISLWDPGSASGNLGWNTSMHSLIGDAANPQVNNTRLIWQVYNALFSQAINYNQSVGPIFAALSGYSGMDTVQLVGLLQDTGVITVDRSDVYCAVGDGVTSFATCRFMISDASTLALSTMVQDCDPVSWSAGSVTFNLRQGRFAALHNVHLWWVDGNGNVTHVGNFT